MKVANSFVSLLVGLIALLVFEKLAHAEGPLLGLDCLSFW